MLTITEIASAYLAAMLAQAGAPEEVAVRFVPGENGVTMVSDEPQPDDTTFDHDGRTVLVLDEQISQLLADKTLDIQNADGEMKMVLF